MTSDMRSYIRERNVHWQPHISVQTRCWKRTQLVTATSARGSRYIFTIFVNRTTRQVRKAAVIPGTICERDIDLLWKSRILAVFCNVTTIELIHAIGDASK